MKNKTTNQARKDSGLEPLTTKRNTVRKKMSTRDYINLMNYFKTGEPEMDLSEYDPKALSKVEVRVMRFNAEEKAKMDEFFGNNPFSETIQTVLCGLPRIKPPSMQPPLPLMPVNVVAPPAPVVAVASAPVPTEAATGERKSNAPWLIDPACKIEPSNIDMAVIVEMTESGQLTEKMFDEFFAGDEDLRCKILASEPSKFECSKKIDDKYRFCNILDSVFVEAEKTYKNYCDIMTEEPPSDEEQAERYKNYILRCHARPKNEKLYGDTNSIDSVVITDNKIIADDDDVYEYEDAVAMTHDCVYLCQTNKLGADVQVDIFGKKTTVNKVIEKLYKKYPSGLPDKDKFYHTRKEAYEDGAITL